MLPPGGLERAVESGNAAVRPYECGPDAADEHEYKRWSKAV